MHTRATIVAVAALTAVALSSCGSDAPSKASRPQSLSALLHGTATAAGVDDVLLGGGTVAVPVRDGWTSAPIPGNEKDAVLLTRGDQALLVDVDHRGGAPEDRARTLLRSMSADETDVHADAVTTIAPRRSELKGEAATGWNGRSKRSGRNPWIAASARVSVRRDGETLTTVMYHFAASRPDVIVDEAIDFDLSQLRNDVVDDFGSRLASGGGGGSTGSAGGGSGGKADAAACPALPFNPDPARASLCNGVVVVPIPDGASIGNRSPTRITYTTTDGIHVDLELSSPQHPNADAELHRYFDASRQLLHMNPPDELPAGSHDYSRQSDATRWNIGPAGIDAEWFSFHRVARVYFQNVICGDGNCEPYTASSSTAEVGYYGAVVRRDGWLLTVQVDGESDAGDDAAATQVYDRNQSLRSVVERSVARFAGA
jgi:hypothetical protein